MMEFIPRVAFDAPICSKILPPCDFPKPTVTTTNGSGSKLYPLDAGPQLERRRRRPKLIASVPSRPY
jgi:hypothetical protein